MISRTPQFSTENQDGEWTLGHPWNPLDTLLGHTNRVYWEPQPNRVYWEPQPNREPQLPVTKSLGTKPFCQFHDLPWFVDVCSRPEMRVEKGERLATQPPNLDKSGNQMEDSNRSCVSAASPAPPCHPRTSASSWLLVPQRPMA